MRNLGKCSASKKFSQSIVDRTGKLFWTGHVEKMEKVWRKAYRIVLGRKTHTTCNIRIQNFLVHVKKKPVCPAGKRVGNDLGHIDYMCIARFNPQAPDCYPRAIALQKPSIRVLKKSLFHPAFLNLPCFDPFVGFALMMLNAQRPLGCGW